jgi:GT2 family glycosyltransferase
MRIACVIPSKNRPDGLARLIASLRGQTVSVHPLLVVDDGSDVPLDEPVGARMLRNAFSAGPARARNQGWRELASEPYVLFADDDVEFVDPEAIARALSHFAKSPRIAIVGFAQLEPGGLVRPMQPAHSTRPALTNRFYSYAFVARTKSLLETGGFYEPLFYYMEEIDLSHRLLGHGWQILFAPDATAVHHEDPRGRNTEGIRVLALRNALVIVIKNYPAWAVPAGLLKSYINHFRMHSADRIGSIRSAIRGSIGFIRMARPAMADRRSIGARALYLYMSLGRHPREPNLV